MTSTDDEEKIDIRTGIGGKLVGRGPCRKGENVLRMRTWLSGREMHGRIHGPVDLLSYIDASQRVRVSGFAYNISFN